MQGIVALLRQSLSEAFGSTYSKVASKENDKSKWFKAVKNSDRSFLKKALKSKFDINAQNRQGQTALMVATYNRDVKVAALLISEGADVNLRDHQLNSPFLYAGAEGYLEILQLIGHRGDVKIVNRYGGIGIIPASERAHYDTLKWLLENTTSDVNHVNRLGWTALLEAIILGDGTDKYVRVVQLLLKHGASQEVADRDGVTASEHAEKLGYTKILNLLTS